MRRSIRLIVLLAYGALPPASFAEPPAAPSPALTVAPAVPPIFEIVQAGDLDRLNDALRADPTVANAEAPSGMTPLGAALNRKNVAAVRALLENGADPNKPFGPLRMHPLQGAAQRGLPDAVDLLLARNADPRAKDGNGGTALHEAVIDGSVDMASRLAGKGADVNAVYTAGPNAGATPLHLAAKGKNMLMIIVLAAHDAHWNSKWNGKTPAELADEAGAKDVADYIRARQAEKK
jgi:ankyrin repeat protein